MSVERGADTVVMSILSACANDNGERSWVDSLTGGVDKPTTTSSSVRVPGSAPAGRSTTLYEAIDDSWPTGCCECAARRERMNPSVTDLSNGTPEADEP